MRGTRSLFGSDDSESDTEVASQAPKRRKCTWQRRQVPVQPPIVMQPFQTAAIDQMTKRVTTGVDDAPVEGQLLMLGTGGGKTAILTETVKACHAFWSSVDQSGLEAGAWGEDTFVWIVSPSAGGNLPIQWQNQLVLSGVSNDNILMQSELVREDQRQRFQNAKGLKIFVCSFHMLHSVMQDVKRKSSAFIRAIKWRVVVVDEVHFYRNGVLSQGDAIYDPEAKMFNTMHSLTKKIRGAGGKVLVTSATPLVNNRVNVYTLLQLMCDGRGYNKELWLQKRSLAGESERMLRLHATLAEMPPEIANRGKVDHVEVYVKLSAEELQTTYDVNLEVGATIEHYKKILMQYGQQRFTNVEARRKIEDAHRRMMSAITSARRCGINMGFSGQTLYEERRQTNKKTGRQKIVRKPVPTPMEKLMNVNDVDLSKYREIRRIVEKHTGQGERVIVATEYARPVDFIVAKLRRDIPSLAVHSHHSKNNTVAAMQSFLQNGGVLVGTRGTFGTGVSIEVTTNHDEEPKVRPVVVVNVDFAFSHAAMAQMNGRTRRPLAQPDVSQWTVYQLVNTASPVMTIDEALMQIVNGKKKMSAEMFDSRNDGEQSDPGNVLSVSTSSDFDGTLNILLKLTNNVPACAVAKSNMERTERRKNAISRKKESAEKKAKRSMKREMGQKISESDGLTSSEDESE